MNNNRGFDQISFVINPSQQIQQDLIMDQILLEGCDHLTPNKLARKRPPELLTMGDGDDDDQSNNQNKQKRAMHRDIERQRRQEMAKQYASLRSLLPLEYIKGKRSISDHVHQAVSYINHLQGRIKEMEVKREKLKKLSNDKIGGGVVETGLGNQNSNDGCAGNSASVTVASCLRGVEILISTSSSMEEGRMFPLSIMVQALDAQKLGVVSCFSTRVNDRLLYTIQCEASDQTTVDLSELQLMVMDVINDISS